MSNTKTVKFIGGPLDGKTRDIAQELKTYEIDEPPPPEDIHEGELPVAFFPPFHRYVYEESQEDKNTFVYRK